MNHRRQLIFSSLLLALTCGLAFAPDAYLTMLARAFTLWWAIGFGVTALVVLWKRWWWASFSSAMASAMLLPVLHMPGLDMVEATGSPDLRVAHLNVLQPNSRHADVLAAIRHADADLVSLQEVSPQWAAALGKGLGEDFSYQLVMPRTNCYGIALFSRLPLHNARVIVLAGAPFIEAEVEADGRRVRLLIAHATSPGSPGQFARRNAQLGALADRIARSALPSVLIGDLNTVHWDDAYRRLCADSGLRPLNHPRMATWPSIGPLAFIPLDHALVRGPIRASTIHSFEIPGSDHRGLLADLHFVHAP
ncbi:MAG: endonuclease/exonuclease/phosphatase family protein [Flavobacteriales bacterium]|jgi:endonuclease/exonuclease/phosphatase (EEP) superfamily protein YafD|nr:endonuclease/exonuclease/phosphatase family protein [Flavobacteriales bacterium]